MTTLTPQQHRIIVAIATGSTITQSAAAENLHRNTITNWRRTNPAFAAELEFATQEYRHHWQDQATALIPKAIQAIEDCLTNPKSSPSLRFRAAALILKMATQTKLGSFVPAAQAAPETEEPAQTCTTPEELASFIPTAETTDSKQNPDPPEEPFTLEQAAKAWAVAQRCTKPQPIRATPQPGRNELCPCNSGQKFKRCCLPKQEAAYLLAAA